MGHMVFFTLQFSKSFPGSGHAAPTPNVGNAVSQDLSVFDAYAPQSTPAQNQVTFKVIFTGPNSEYYIYSTILHILSLFSQLSTEVFNVSCTSHFSICHFV